MKILSADQIREWDEYTIKNEPISSLDLMERAANACTEWIEKNTGTASRFMIFCGKGNNGGDGLAIARMLALKEYPVHVHIPEFGHLGTDDFQSNLARLHEYPSVEIRFIQSEEHFPQINKTDLVIDALYGSGLNRALDGMNASLVEYINRSGSEIISIDIPSGLFVDKSSVGNKAIKADHTLSFQVYKTALLLPENAAHIGTVQILDIGLHQDYYESANTKFELTDLEIARSILIPRNRFSHKGIFGHALLLAGSYGKMGAAVLASKACLQSGAGLLTCHVPAAGYAIMQTTVPEAMISTDFNSSFLTKTELDISRYNAVGIGPGIGTASETSSMLDELMSNYAKPLVLDADALNIIAKHPELLKKIPKDSIITPHPLEFKRLFGECENDFTRIELAIEKAAAHKIIIILKGHHTIIATPGGKVFFNSTGNAGMAKGGSGDVLTGLITGILAQGCDPVLAALFSVYLHGLAGDLAAEKCSEYAMSATDIIDNISAAFKVLA
jgi:ADP-dependent NAD(P)H-hydrate dehydratase / NAD(P)H-hydrate epimerase